MISVCRFNIQIRLTCMLLCDKTNKKEMNKDNLIKNSSFLFTLYTITLLSNKSFSSIGMILSFCQKDQCGQRILQLVDRSSYN